MLFRSDINDEFLIKILRTKEDHFFVFWIDDEDGTAHISLMPLNRHGICFTWETDEKEGVVKIYDHGLIQEQYLIGVDKHYLATMGIKPGDTFTNINKVWDLIIERNPDGILIKDLDQKQENESN